MNSLSVNTSLVRQSSPAVQRVMLQVLLALLPGAFAMYWLTGTGIILNLLFACCFAVGIECAVLRLRKKPLLGEGTDLSIVVAASLLALALPPTLPIGQLFIGVAVLVLLGKHVFGGLGQNPFNPAMVAYTALFISFPQSMTLWFEPAALSAMSLSETVAFKCSFSELTLQQLPQWDAITKATPLEHLRTLKLQQQPVNTELANSTITQAPWMLINSGFLVGGLYLLWRNIIQWQIPVAVLASFALASVLYAAFTQTPLPGIAESMFSGALIFGAFFIATDPVTAASSATGRIVYGAGIGFLAFIIRYFGGYPEGFAFAVLLMNVCSPTIDHVLSTSAKT